MFIVIGSIRLELTHPINGRNEMTMKRFSVISVAILGLIAAISFAVIAATSTTKDKDTNSAAKTAPAATAPKQATPESIDAVKQRMLTNIEKKSHVLDQYKSCVNGSQNVDALKSCAQAHKLAEKQLSPKQKKPATSQPAPTSKPK